MKTSTVTPPSPVSEAQNSGFTLPKSVRITGTLTLTSPFHQSCVRPCWADVSRMKATGERLDFPATGTVTMPVLLTGPEPSVDPADGADATKKKPPGRVFVPVMKENSIRGYLRRIGCRLMFAALADRHEVVSAGTYRGMTCGAVTGNGNSVHTLDTALAARKNTFLALFGGGPRMCRTHYRIGLVPAITDATIKARMVPEEYKDLAARSELDLTYLVAFIRNDEMIRFMDPLANSVIRDYPAALTQWMDQLADNKGARNSEKAAKKERAAAVKLGTKKLDRKVEKEVVTKTSKVALQGFNFTEVVVPGTSFHFDFTLLTDRMPLASLGLFIQSLTVMANEQHIGGWGRNGYGRFSTDANLIIDGVKVGKLFDILGGEYSPACSDEGNLVQAALDAWATTAATMTAAELDDLYLPGKEDAKDEPAGDPSVDNTPEAN